MFVHIRTCISAYHIVALAGNHGGSVCDSSAGLGEGRVGWQSLLQEVSESLSLWVSARFV